MNRNNRLTPLVIVVALAMLTTATACPRNAPPAAALVGAPPTATSSNAAHGNLWYRLALREERLDVAVRLFAPPEHTKFFLPGPWAGRDDLASVIGITGATTSLGAAEVQLDRREGVVQVDTRGAEWVELTYRVDFSARSNFHPQREHGVFVGYGPTFLVTPAQQVLERTRQIPIELHTAPQADVVATWRSFGSAPSTADARTVHRFVAADAAELRDAFVVAGARLSVQRLGEDEQRVEVAFSPAFKGDRAAITDAIARSTYRYRQQYGSAGATHVFVRARATAEEFGGFGRRGGFVLELAPRAELDIQTELLIAHEALHIWNGHLIGPKPEFEASTRWFKEGVTHYLALKAVATGGAFVRAELTKIAANYTRNPLVHKDGAVRDIDHARLPYDFGFLVALAMDRELARTSNDLSCWLRMLLTNAERAYDEQALLAAIQQCAGPGTARDVERVWRDHVRNDLPLDVAALFASIGLHWLPEVDGRPARLVPLDGVPHTYLTMFGATDD